MSDMTAPPQNPPRNLACAQCGGAFDCTSGAECWCVAEPYRLRMIDIDTQRDCLCPACLRLLAAAQSPSDTVTEA